MGLLKPIENEQAYLKAGIYGEAGSGKTFTSSKVAIGLAKKIGAKTIAFFDTETGSDYVKDKLFAPEGIDLVGLRSKVFIECVQVINECIKSDIKILIIDSVTHLWEELINAHLIVHRRKRLRLWDWGPLKEE